MEKAQLEKVREALIATFKDQIGYLVDYILGYSGTRVTKETPKEALPLMLNEDENGRLNAALAAAYLKNVEPYLDENVLEVLTDLLQEQTPIEASKLYEQGQLQAIANPLRLVGEEMLASTAEYIACMETKEAVDY